MNDKTVLAIDPGTSKCGMALVRRDADGRFHLLWRAVAPTEGFVSQLDEAAAVAPYEVVVVGDGTHHRQVVAAIRERSVSTSILVVDEKDTSYQARERYWEHHPRRGWRRIVPSTLQVPPGPVDDFVALILAERALSGY